MHNKATSFFLDFIRVVASFYVFFFHIGSMQIGGNKVFATKTYVDDLGLKYSSVHYFVILFFLLSSLLITMSATKPNGKLLFGDQSHKKFFEFIALKIKSISLKA
jgi:peptidoglycan/LPS O-acetylase OafA/YrhL